ncbi:MAG: ectoine/hydroxyectoine ABC transporter ATP-binding protein EhuA [Phycisphaerae bacterium]|nr:MAG: ectoine/hydroxyectoine ABC transporter ATP-binding protein EhuA [Phycisphaerae bacterium]
MTVPPIISIRGLNKRFGSTVVLKDFNIDVNPSERLSIIGPSGSGKSTLLRILMTLERPDAGTVQIDGESLWHMEKNGTQVPANKAHLRKMRAKIGMVFQHFNLFPHMTALRNVSIAPQHVGQSERKNAETRAAELLDQVGLGDKLDAYPAQLSGGQKQRVGIARALAMQPKIMLFDEVTSALDPELVGEVLGVLRKLARETDMTMLLVTHEMRFAQEISDRVAFMDHGRVLELDKPSTIFTEPQHARTREFLNAVLES